MVLVGFRVSFRLLCPTRCSCSCSSLVAYSPKSHVRLCPQSTHPHKLPRSVPPSVPPPLSHRTNPSPPQNRGESLSRSQDPRILGRRNGSETRPSRTRQMLENGGRLKAYVCVGFYYDSGTTHCSFGRHFHRTEYREGLSARPLQKKRSTNETHACLLARSFFLRLPFARLLCSPIVITLAGFLVREF